MNDFFLTIENHKEAAFWSALFIIFVISILRNKE